MHADQEDRHPWLALREGLWRRCSTTACRCSPCASAPSSWPRRPARPARRASEPEIGWHEVEVTARARRSAARPAGAAASTAFQWHSYEALPPEGAVDARPQPGLPQAYRLGEAAWGIQFHAEVTPPSAAHGSTTTRPTRTRSRIGLDPDALRGRDRETIGDWNELGRELCGRFLDVAATLLGREVGAGEPAVDQEGRGGDVRGLVAGQEERALRDLARPRRSGPSAGGPGAAPPCSGRSRTAPGAAAC